MPSNLKLKNSSSLSVGVTDSHQRLQFLKFPYFFETTPPLPTAHMYQIYLVSNVLVDIGCIISGKHDLFIYNFLIL